MSSDDAARRRRPSLLRHVPDGRAGTAAVIVIVVVLVLVALDLTVPDFRRWWAYRPLTASITAGFLVVLVTVLVVDRVLRLRQLADRALVIAAQAAILMAQASRTAQAVAAALNASGDREDASDEVRTYMSMLLVAAPVLIDAKRPRGFLMEAQHLGAELVRLMAASRQSPGEALSTDERLDAAVQRLRAASVPLLAVLEPEQRTLTEADGSPFSAPAPAAGRRAPGPPAPNPEQAGH